MSLYSDRDLTFEKLVDLLVRVTNERDQALERCKKANEDLYQYMAFPESKGLQRVPPNGGEQRG